MSSSNIYLNSVLSTALRDSCHLPLPCPAMNRMGRTIWRYGLFAALLAAFVVFLLWPIFLTVKGGFTDESGAFTMDYLRSIFADQLAIDGLVNALLIAVGTTILCLIIAMPLALLSTRFAFPGKTLLGGLILVPLILPPFVGAIGLKALLGRFGAVNALLMDMGWLNPDEPGIDFLRGDVFGGPFLAVIIMEALHLYPILYLNLTAALANLDPTLDEAATNLGASRLKRFFRITLPLILPGAFAGATIVFVWSFTELGTPLMFDFYTVTPVQVFWGIQEVQDNPRPYALVVVMLVVAVGLYLLGKFIFGGRAYAMQSKASIGATTRRLPFGKGLLVTGLFASVIGLAILPHIGVIFSSFAVDGTWYRSVMPGQWTDDHYRNALSHDLAMGSIANSLLYASAAMGVCVLVGLTLSYLTVRAKIFGGWLLDALAMLPLAVPGLVMAFGYVAMSLEINGMLEARGWKDIPSWLQITGTNPNPVMFLVIAYAVRRLPYVVRSVSAGLEQTSGALEDAARNLGASPMYAIRRIVVPLIMANIIAGGILAFSFAMLEVSDSLMLAQKEQHYPITKAIYSLYNRLGDGPYIASAMGVWGMALLTLTLIGASLLLGKRLGAVFRV